MNLWLKRSSRKKNSKKIHQKLSRNKMNSEGDGKAAAAKSYEKAETALNSTVNSQRTAAATTTATAPAAAPSSPPRSATTKSANARERSNSGEKRIDLNDFLDLLKVSCHVNEMITNNINRSQHNDKDTKASRFELDFKKLTENRLINELYNHKKAKPKFEAPQPASETSNNNMTASTINDRARPKRRNSIVGNTVRTNKRTEAHRTNGLHPKLNEKLDFVINEGVLDSVLPFICPVKVPQPQPRKNRKDLHYKTTSASASANTMDKECNYMPNEGQASTKRRTSVGGRKESDVVIHVCDEVKKTSKDFTCPQSLLVSKMGYFADVTAGQKLEDMDISVHCDINIFEWLMKWVKCSARNEQCAQTGSALVAGPQLDATNVVPILVSASFLQMEPLMLECLSFCHSRLTEIVRAPTNLTCLNDALITRLAAMFTNLELEMVRDKKERVTPRLWTKLIQSLCEPEPEALRGHYYSLSGLFRCSKCGKCLTNTMKSYVPCLSCNLRLNRWGQLVSHHVRDNSWDINLFIIQLFKELKSWRRVYWRLWGYCHFLYCYICETHFPAYQMPWCRYHPENPHYLGPVTEGRIAGPTGRFPCCGQQAFRFETLPGPNGCQFREHSVLVDTDRERAILSIVQFVGETGNALFENPPEHFCQVLANGEAIEPRWMGLSLVPQRCRQGLLPVLNPDESTSRIARRVRNGIAYFQPTTSESETSDTGEETVRRSRSHQLLPGTNFRRVSPISDGCESESTSPHFVSTKKSKKRQPHVAGRYWSGELSARSNQDHQREFEEKVMKKVMELVKKRSTGDTRIAPNPPPMGGSYVRLEAEWRENLKQRTTVSLSNSSSTATLTRYRNK